jgi:acetoacetyl-CoA synthetase
MGTSEIYSAVEGVPAVLDSLVVDVEDEMILFVVVRDALTGEVVGDIRRRVREHCSPRHVPDRVVQIPEVPRTLSNKKLEVPVKKILLGVAPESAASRDSLANPDALDWIAEFAVRASSAPS